jgi:AcrR family transcriptional regulator
MSMLINKNKVKKSVKTRLKLQQNARQLFELKGYSGVTVQDITERSGVAPGTFYIYFKNKDELLLEICKEFLDRVVAELATLKRNSDPFVGIYEGQFLFIKLVAENWQLYRSMLSYSLSEPQLGEHWHLVRVREGQRMVAYIAEKAKMMGAPLLTSDGDDALTIAMALNSTIEGYIQDMFRILPEGAKVAPADINAVARLMTRIFARAAFLREAENI